MVVWGIGAAVVMDRRYCDRGVAGIAYQKSRKREGKQENTMGVPGWEGVSGACQEGKKAP